MKIKKVEDNLSYEKLCDLEKDYLKPQIVPDGCEFWMLRSKRGVFYHEFLESRYIAIGWNAILKRDFETDSEEQRKAKIISNYPNEIRPKGCINKCYRFAFDMKPGDIVLLVGSGEVAFCLVGDYYEEIVEDAVVKEIEANSQMERDNYKGFSIPCPYSKRRKITCFKKMDENCIAPTLYRAISNRHSLSNLDDYATGILSECFDFFSYKQNTYFAFRVTTENPIDARELSRFLFYTTELLSGEEELPISTKVSLNSPGTVVLSIAMDAITYICEHPLVIATLMISLFGGDINLNGFAIKMPSVRSAIKDIRDRKHEKRMNELEERKQEAEIRKINAEALKTEVEAYKGLNDFECNGLISDEKISQKYAQAINSLQIAKPNLKIVDFSQSGGNATPKKVDTVDNAGEKK